ncbi:MAG: YetF domain-containing protein [Halanaerobiales bacterium]
MDFWQAQSSLAPYQWIIRTVVTVLWLVVLTRLMGQRQVGRLTLFDFIIAIITGSVAAAGLTDPGTSLGVTLISLAALAALDIVLSFLSVKYSRLRRVVQGEPKILIKNGDLQKSVMKQARVNMDDLLMGLREKKVPNLHDVEFAVLEPNGKISVIPRSQARTVKPKDLNLDTGYEGYPVMIIEDGNILEDNLRENNLDRDWLYGELKKQGIQDEEQVMAAMLDTGGRLFVNIQEDNQ